MANSNMNNNNSSSSNGGMTNGTTTTTATMEGTGVMLMQPVNASGSSPDSISSSSTTTTTSSHPQQQQQQPKTLYVGNLDPQVSEELLLGIFTPLGQVTGCKIIHEAGNDPYAFVEFSDHGSANMAMATMNKRHCMGREMKVNWATSPGSGTGPKQDTSRHHHIFIGDLAPEIETQQLRDAFSPFGDISDCRVVRDPQTLKSKGYGFVSFVKKSEAEHAITTMNGQWLGSRAIRTNWATRKPSNPRSSSGINGAIGLAGGMSQGPGGMTGALLMSGSSLMHHHHPGSILSPTDGNGMGGGGHGQHHSNKLLSFEEIYQQSSPTNCTVYCGGIINGLSEEVIKSSFAPFGPIHEVRVFKDKGYAFIKFASKEAAASAILSLNGSEIQGQVVKCSWGKESGDPNNQLNSVAAVYASAAAAAAAAAAANAGYPSPYGHLGYWYPGAAAAAITPAAAAYPQALALAAAHHQQQQQQQQHHHHHQQGNPGYGQASYGQYYGSNPNPGSSVNGSAFNSAAAAAVAAAANMQMAWQSAGSAAASHHHQQQQQQQQQQASQQGQQQHSGPPHHHMSQHGMHMSTGASPAPHHSHHHSHAGGGGGGGSGVAGGAGPGMHHHHALTGAYLQQAPYQAQ